MFISVETAYPDDEKFTPITASGVLFSQNSLIDQFLEGLGPVNRTSGGAVFRHYLPDSTTTAVSYSAVQSACLLRGELLESEGDLSPLLDRIGLFLASLPALKGDCFIALLRAADGKQAAIVHDITSDGGIAFLVLWSDDGLQAAFVPVEGIEPLPKGATSLPVWDNAAFRSVLPNSSELAVIHSASVQGLAYSMRDGSIDVVLNRSSGPLVQSVCIREELLELRDGSDVQRYAEIGLIGIARKVFSGARTQDSNIDLLAYFICSKGDI